MSPSATWPTIWPQTWGNSMEEAQRSVFQGIVYYYRENQVLCRYQITLHDAVDPTLLQRALDAVRPLAGYYFQKVVWEKRECHLEPNDAPCLVRQSSTQPVIPDETNDYQFALSCEGDTIYLDWFHFLADGRGGSPFMTLLVKEYCNLRYGENFACEKLVEVSPFDVDEILAQYPESQVENDMQKSVVEMFEGEPDRARVRLDKQSLVELALKNKVKPFSALTALLSKATRDYLGKDTIQYSYAADLRDAIGKKGALYNCIASFQRPLVVADDSSFADYAPKVDADIRETLKPENRRFRMAEQMGWVYKVYQQKAPLKIKKRIYQMGEYISGFPADFWVSYLGDPFLPADEKLEGYIKDFQTWVLPDGASIGLEAMTLHGVITLCIENKAKKPGYAEAVRNALEAEGVKVLEAVEL